VFSRRREPSVQTLPEYFNDSEEDDSEGGFWNYKRSASRHSRKYCQSESELYENVHAKTFDNLLSNKVRRLSGSDLHPSRYISPATPKINVSSELGRGLRLHKSSNELRRLKRPEIKNISYEDEPEMNGFGHENNRLMPDLSTSTDLSRRTSIGLPYSAFFMRN